MKEIDFKKIHKSNILTKIKDEKDQNKLKILNEIKVEYKKFSKSLIESFESKNFILSSTILYSYLIFIKEKQKALGYSSQSKFESTIIEEFVSTLMYVRLKETLSNKGITSSKLLVGPSSNYSKFLFSPENINDFIENSDIKIDKKNQDASISKNTKLIIDGSEIELSVPIISLECKTYLDKTMLEGSISTSNKIKAGNPYCFFGIVALSYEVGKDVELKQTNINQIYSLAKEQKRDKSNNGVLSIYEDVIETLSNDIYDHLNSNWISTGDNLKSKGTVIN